MAISSIQVKVKATLVQAMRVCTVPTAHRGSRGIALPFHDHGTRRGRGVRVTPRPHFTPGKDPIPIVQEAGWASGPVWTGAENLVPTGIWSPDRPAHSQSLYGLRYPAHKLYALTGTRTNVVCFRRVLPSRVNALGYLRVSGIPNCLNWCEIFIMHAEFANVTAGGKIKTDGPRVGNPWFTHTT